MDEWQSSLDLLVLELDRLSIHKNTLSLVRFWFSPHPNIRCKLHYHLFLWTFQ